MNRSPHTERIQFTNEKAERLSGVLHLPDGIPRTCVLYATCFTCSKDIPIASRLGHALANAGFAMLRFDHAGLGDSEGDFHNNRFGDLASDLMSAAAWLKQRGLPPQLLIGHSIGGGIVLNIAPRLPDVRAVITLAAPANLEHLASLLRKTSEKLDDGGVSVVLGGRRFNFSPAFIDDLETQRPFTQAAQGLGRPLLVLHAPEDETVPYAHGLALFEAASEPRAFVSLDGTDHLLRRLADVDYVATLISGWSSRYVETDHGSTRQDRPAIRDTEVLVRSRRDQRYTQDIYTRDHHWIADEPLIHDGANVGPAPFPLLLSALGACTAMTLQAYAARKTWPLSDVTVRLDHQATKNSQFSISRHIDVEGPLSDTQCERLLEIANRCPVHRALSKAPIQIHTELQASTKIKP